MTGWRSAFLCWIDGCQSVYNVGAAAKMVFGLHIAAAALGEPLMTVDRVSKLRAVSGEHNGPGALLGTRRFSPLFLTQFLGTFNSALLTAMLVVLSASSAATWTALSSESLIMLGSAILIFPFLVFSAAAGQLVDKYDKAILARLVKILEMLIIGTAALGLLQHSVSALLGALCLLGLHATLLGLVKCAILPQHLNADELVNGNALMVMGTVVAMLTGVISGVLVSGENTYWWLVTAMLIVALTGFLASLCLPNAPPVVSGLIVKLNPVAATRSNIGLARQDRTVFVALLGMSWVWFVGGLLTAQFPTYARNMLSANENSAILLPATFAVGIGAGAMLCEALSGRSLEIGLLSFGAMGQALFALDLSFALPQTLPSGAPLALSVLLGAPGFWRVFVDLGALGVFLGLYVVSLNVLIQTRSAPDQRARILSVGRLLDALALLAGSFIVASVGGATLPWLFAAAALGFAAVGACAYFQEPHLSLRFLTGVLIHSFYRLGKSGFEHIPATGPAVLVCNHVSFVDSVVIMAAVRRPIRFVIDHRIHQTPVAGFLFRHSRTIPIATAKENPALKEAAFDAVAHALKNGELIGLFPEGGITHTGEIKNFRYGVGRIVTETPVPVIPMALRGLWGSFFSRRYGAAMSKPSLLRLFARIELVVGEPVPAERVTPDYLQEIVGRLRGDLR